MDTDVYKIVNSSDYSSVDSFVQEELKALDPDGKLAERSFYVADMSDVYKKLLLWKQHMARVKPYYAIKCNNMPEIVKFLAACGTNFDCASKEEIQQVLSFGVKPEQIIYANPCKSSTFIKYAQTVGVDLMTFDDEFELHKVAQQHPQARLVLRIKGDEANSRCKFNSKFGADLEKCPSLLKLAKDLNLNIVGVSFHNGSDGGDPMAYYRSIERARQVFDQGKDIGHKMNLLDIGGGFPGDNNGSVKFEEVFKQVNKALDTFFPEGSGYEIIAEPGRYFVASAFVLMCMITSKRIEVDSKTNVETHIYYLNDGVYGAFTGILYESQRPKPKMIECAESSADRPMHPSVFWGQTCDSMDCITPSHTFPEHQLGEWVKFENMGAYTLSCATCFNGFEKAHVIMLDKMDEPSASYLRLAIESTNKTKDKLSAIDCPMNDLEKEAARQFGYASSCNGRSNGIQVSNP